MTEQTNHPPRLQKTSEGGIETNSLADLLEWFLNFDERVAAVRHPFVQELFIWKQQEDKMNGVEIYPFESAEDRFAVGFFQALGENDNKIALHNWISQVLQALNEAKETNNKIAEDYKLANKQGVSPLLEAQNLPSRIEQKIYLTTCWLEALCTAEVRVLGWVYQELYGKPYNPNEI